MGRRLLLSLGACGLLAGCQWLEPVEISDRAHVGVECAECHTGARADRGLGASDVDGCTAAGCHSDGGPGRAELLTPGFAHRDHGGDSVSVATGCAGCHAHTAGGEPLTASMTSCSLCHISDAASGNAAECRLCHADPEHVALTTQGVAIPHRDVPRIDGGCIRCHYDVSPVPVEVSVLSCGTCHQDTDAAVAEAGSRDPHPDHTGVACGSCHQDEPHEVRAISSAVALECGDCHARIHDVEPSPEWPGTATCNACHEAVHAPQQALFLGMVPGVAGSRPSDKFMDGLSCRSCHVASPAQDPEEALNGSADGCVGCHRSEYGEVLDWWIEGADRRLATVRRAVERGAQRLEASGAAGPRLDSAQIALRAVEEGGPVHNLPLAHDLLVRAQRQVEQAYRDGGAAPPATTDLGSTPSMGLCTYCHYRTDDAWAFQEMSGEFHREAMRRTR